MCMLVYYVCTHIHVAFVMITSLCIVGACVSLFVYSGGVTFKDVRISIRFVDLICLCMCAGNE